MRRPESEREIDWESCGSLPLAPDTFDMLWCDALRALSAKPRLYVTDRVLGGEDLTLSMRADLRMAATYATEASRTVTEWCHLACGTTAIREGSRLERAFRDLYTGSQHAFISEKTYIDAAGVLLGLTDAVPGL